VLAGQNREAEEAARTAYEKSRGDERGVAREVQGDAALGNGNLDLAAEYYHQAAVLSEPDPLRARAEEWKAAEIYFEQGKPQAALDMARSRAGFGAAEVRGVAYLILGDRGNAEEEFSSARSAMVPFFSDYKVNTLIELDRLRAARFSKQWRQVVDGWPSLADDIKPQNGFLAGRAYSELALFPQAETELRSSLSFVCAGGLISDDIDFLQVELGNFYLGNALEHEGKKTDAMKSYRAFLSHFEHSSAGLPQIDEARNALLHPQ
jgi:tetratricopeptide (TPR) repeat protein